MPDTTFTPAEKAACARRELAYRKSCYVRWDKVASEADLKPARRREIALMEAIAADYERQAGEAWAMAPAQPVQAQLFPAGCAKCGQRPDQCLCAPVTFPRSFFPREDEPPF